MLMKKVAEAVCNETSATAPHGMLCGLGYKVSKATLLDHLAMPREIGNLLKPARIDESIRRLLIVTKEEEEEIVEGDTRIEVKPARKFLLQDLV